MPVTDPSMTPDPVVQALLASAAGDRERAREALAGSDDALAVALARGLEADPADVYVEPEAFTRFIAGGTNPALYDATGDALRRRWIDGAHGLLDIGCGDGRVTAVVVGPGDRVHLCEPAVAMARDAVAAVTATGAVVASITNQGIEELLDTGLPEAVRRVQATFALHNLDPDRRRLVFGALAGLIDELALVEFDVPAFVDQSIEHARYCARTYRRGLQQHADPLVVDGFLMPVLLGQFEPGRERHTHEQPISAWAEELRRAGFLDVTVTPVFDGFWWGPASMVAARGRS